MLNVFSVFKSISGEVGTINQGAWCIFIRLAGCNLKCSYCDTQQAQERTSGTLMSVSHVLDLVDDSDLNGVLPVIITGGEPLLQPIQRLVGLLKDQDRRVQIETNGSIPDHLDWFGREYVCLVMDYKLSSSGMKDRMIPVTDFAKLSSYHWIKFVCSNRTDFEEAVEVMKTIKEINPLHARFALSACTPGLTINKLFTWMRAERLTGVVLNVQIHKLCKIIE